MRPRRTPVPLRGALACTTTDGAGAGAGVAGAGATISCLVTAAATGATGGAAGAATGEAGGVADFLATATGEVVGAGAGAGAGVVATEFLSSVSWLMTREISSRKADSMCAHGDGMVRSTSEGMALTCTDDGAGAAAGAGADTTLAADHDEAMRGAGGGPVGRVRGAGGATECLAAYMGAKAFMLGEAYAVPERKDVDGNIGGGKEKTVRTMCVRVA